MKFIPSYEALYDRLDKAHRAAAADTLSDIRRNEVRRTGRLANSFRTFEVARGTERRRLVTIYIASDGVPYADAVEHGANAREKASVRKGTRRRRTNGEAVAGPLLNRASRRGPHMEGNHIVLEHGASFLAHMSYRLSRP